MELVEKTDPRLDRDRDNFFHIVVPSSSCFCSLGGNNVSGLSASSVARELRLGRAGFDWARGRRRTGGLSIITCEHGSVEGERSHCG